MFGCVASRTYCHANQSRKGGSTAARAAAAARVAAAARAAAGGGGSAGPATNARYLVTAGGSARLRSRDSTEGGPAKAARGKNFGDGSEGVNADEAKKHEEAEKRES